MSTVGTVPPRSSKRPAFKRRLERLERLAINSLGVPTVSTPQAIWAWNFQPSVPSDGD